MQITIRPLVPQDAESAAEVFFDAVQNGTSDVYSYEQRHAWAGPAPDPLGWLKKFREIAGFAADIDGSMVGFMTLDPTGYIDLAFVRSDLSGRGIGRSLYMQIEAHATACGLAKLTSEASKKAKPFFLRMGWRVDQEQVVVKKSVPLTNFRMSRILEA